MSDISSTTSRPALPKSRAATPRTAAAAESTRGRTLATLILGFLLGGIATGVIVRQHYLGYENRVIASVNGVNITKPDFVRRLEITDGPTILRQLVSEELQLQFARKIGVLPTDAQVEQRYNELSKQPNFEKNLASSGMTTEEFKRSLLATLAGAAVMDQGVTVSPEEIKAFYLKNIDKKNLNARFYAPETVQVAAIVTKNEQQAQKAISELNRGVEFGELVKKYSVDNSKATGGVLSPIPRGRTKMSRVPGMEDALFGLKIGGTLGPRKFVGAWWVIRCLDKAPEKTQPFEQVRTDCELGAKLLKGIPANAKTVQDRYHEFQKSAKIQAFSSRDKKVVDNL